MFLSGKFVDVELWDYHSYKDLGLKCILCGENVDLKKGNIG